ncbi:E3 ubiquitin-protein ligase MIEL1 isoform X1 [Amborella trichopoda]|uniref:CHY-type domain-containing protein n=1 Tax=Amborella trichopoda TaxID=13333 RepID=W1P810_AMBTC|nr:E3 ubiquitin-protein ligase MIEL1 isoform X1 [Amborella trichopoda]ERN06022.1 hypothetical protein AMTR_s00142p00031670 [Amborella trichopoda]|eukprot:XP_006844347.1 E3 ubiquitin-protein ligase MIEL1 isoform X1 [Amborella trichopoda]
METVGKFSVPLGHDESWKHEATCEVMQGNNSSTCTKESRAERIATLQTREEDANIQYVDILERGFTQYGFINDSDIPERGFMQYGCSHYRRRCRIRAPCCNKIFDCRHCHNEAMNSIDVEKMQRHDLPRHQVRKVICSLCNTEQDVRQVCINCGVCMGKYFCETCKLFDDDLSKNQYHCNGCGICRTGGRDNFFHCYKCGCCYSVMLKTYHPCVERAMHHDCPVCFEYLFESTNDITVLPCGHTIHVDCLKEMRDHLQFFCPLCSKSVCDMSKVWEKLDMEIAATPMPESYQNKMVWILCNDCGETSQVQFHIVAQKCLSCKSYNTRVTRGDHTTPTASAPE